MQETDAAALLRTVTGTLLDASGAAVEDVPLALQRAGEPAARTRTLPGGYFRFQPVEEGEYELVVGDPLGPLLPRRRIALDARTAEQDLVVPVLLVLEIRVADEQGLPVPGAQVEGSGESGGRVAGETDADGRLHADKLPPGNYRLFARHPGVGRGNRAFVLSAEPQGPLEIRVLSRPPDL